MLIGASPVRAQAGVQGWSFTWTITSSLRGQTVPAGEVTFDVAVWNGIARITPRGGQAATRALLSSSGVILVSATDSLLTVLNDARREALVASPGELSAMGNAAGTMQLTVTDVASTLRRGGASEPMATYATTRVTVDERYTMAVRVQQMQRVVQVTEESTLDLSAALGARDRGFDAFYRLFVRALGKPEAVRVALQAKQPRLPRGVPVRTRVVTTTVTGADSGRVESEGRMSALQRVMVDTASFRVPAGYRITEVRRLLQPRGRP